MVNLRRGLPPAGSPSPGSGRRPFSLRTFASAQEREQIKGTTSQLINVKKRAPAWIVRSSNAPRARCRRCPEMRRPETLQHPCCKKRNHLSNAFLGTDFTYATSSRAQHQQGRCGCSFTNKNHQAEADCLNRVNRVTRLLFDYLGHELSLESYPEPPL